MKDFYLNAELDLEQAISVINGMPGEVIIYKADTDDILYLNKDIITLFGCTSYEEFMNYTGGKFMSLVHEHDREVVTEEITRQISLDAERLDHITYRIRTMTNEVKMIEDYGRKVTIKGLGDVFVVFIVDNDSKDIQFSNDKLTGLEGKGQFILNVDRMLKLNALKEEPDDYVMIYTNQTNFKLINLKYGSDVGDEVLRRAATFIKTFFSADHVTRVNADQFAICTKADHLHEILSQGIVAFEQGVQDIQLEISIGVYALDKNNPDVEKAIECAKVACDSIKGMPTQKIAYFNENMRHKFLLREYVVNHIDEAIEKGYIQPYYQPVVRSLTGSLCGFEALARWIDPEEGFLSPADFIPALEDAHLIHKLDMEIIRQACERYRYNEDHNIPNVPVSFNLSRLDFMLADVRKDIIEAAEKYSVPHNMLNIEITESLFNEEADIIKNEIEYFQSQGFNVWMDDFGSGYSSLNTLKDYEFDELKIDMAFLSTFNDRSKDILKTIVRMAKKIDIQTLAEGVETKEHYEFLKEIGCEKIQGYYFGKPMPYDDAIAHIYETNMDIEEAELRDYYDDIGKVDLLTELPLALIEYDGLDHFDYFHMNDAYLRMLSGFGTHSREQWKQEMNLPNVKLIRKFRALAYRAIESEKEETLVYSDRGKYARLTIKIVGEYKHHYAFMARLVDISHDDVEEKNSRDEILRHLYSLYSGIFVMNPADDTIESIASEYAKDTQKIGVGIKDKLGNYARSYFTEDLQQDFLDFMNPDTLEERIEKQGNGFVSKRLLTRCLDGSYKMCIHTIVRVLNAGNTQYIACYREDVIEE